MKKIVLLGDSIRMGYDKYVKEALDGVAEAIPSHTDKSVVLTLTREIDTELIKKTVEDAGYTFVS